MKNVMKVMAVLPFLFFGMCFFTVFVLKGNLLDFEEVFQLVSKYRGYEFQSLTYTFVCLSYFYFYLGSYDGNGYKEVALLLGGTVLTLIYFFGFVHEYETGTIENNAMVVTLGILNFFLSGCMLLYLHNNEIDDLVQTKKNKDLSGEELDSHLAK